jgi:hypothetical protein
MGRDLEVNGHGLIQILCAWRDWGIPRMIQVRIASIPAEIRPEHLQDTMIRPITM